VTATSASTGATGTITSQSIRSPPSPSRPIRRVFPLQWFCNSFGQRLRRQWELCGESDTHEDCDIQRFDQHHLCTATIGATSAGLASCPATITDALPDTITANYGGDANYVSASASYIVSNSTSPGTWTWMSGANTPNQFGSYGTLGIPHRLMFQGLELAPLRGSTHRETSGCSEVMASL